MMEIKLMGKRALVTGGSRGIGKAIVQKLLECQASVVAVGKSRDNLAALKKEYPQVETVELDLGGDWMHVRDTIANLGVLDLVVSNAGVYIRPDELEDSMENIDKLFKINYYSAVNICRLTAKSMVEHGRHGSIVIISSISGLRGGMGGLYGTTKAALNHLTQNLAVEYGPNQIRVNCVCPGITDTDMIHQQIREGLPSTLLNTMVEQQVPMKRMSQPDEVADVVAFLLSDLARMVTGVILPVDGGHSCHM